MSEFARSPINFGGIEEKYSSFDYSRVIISPVSFGTDFNIGATAIINASRQLELYEEETDAEVYKIGIHTFKQFKPHENPETLMTALYEHSKQLISNDKFSCVIGGERSVSVPFIRAHNEKFYDMSVLQIGAYADLRDRPETDSYAQSNVMSRVIREMKIPAVQVGVRSISVEEIYILDENPPTKIFWAKDIAGNLNWIDEAANSLTENVYLTIDISGLDPSIVSTSRPQPGGLGWYETLGLIKKVAEKHNIVGMDLVEYATNQEENSSAFLCAKLIYKTLAYIFKNDTIKVLKA